MKVIPSAHGIIKGWFDYVPVEEEAIQQLKNLADMPFIHKWVSAMPDAHLGKGACVGSVIATDKAIIPASVGVDIGCGMIAIKTDLKADDLPEDLHKLRCDIEKSVPVGMSSHKDTHVFTVASVTSDFIAEAKNITEKANISLKNAWVQLGTLGGGNHFIEICLDEDCFVWIMLHSGSRGIGNKLGRYYIEKAKEEMSCFYINLVDKDLAYLPEDSRYFNDYINALDWCQKYAFLNREIMLKLVVEALEKNTKPFNHHLLAINCHHNYVSKEKHYGKNVYVTRKGAVSARKGEFGIIPSNMGNASYIVRGLGNEESFCSCSHGAGRVMSRTQAKKEISKEEHLASVAGVECRSDDSILDESPKAYKNIEDVMRSQSDLVEIVTKLKQVLCVKG